jgi:hypothetical protein
LFYLPRHFTEVRYVIKFDISCAKIFSGDQTLLQTSVSEISSVSVVALAMESRGDVSNVCLYLNNDTANRSRRFWHVYWIFYSWHLFYNEEFETFIEIQIMPTIIIITFFQFSLFKCLPTASGL